MKDRLIIATLAIIMSLNFIDVITDIGLGVPTWHIVEEGVIVLLSAIAVVYLVVEMMSRTRELAALSTTLANADQHLANITMEMKRARRQYSEVIHQQFDEWRLTTGEQQVGLLLLKGLSFKEIAAVRSTQEKTVRQQASTIYGKSGVEGRHAFSAWFLEDFMVAKKPA
ncbi:MAG: LuxR family transcriptional regulator [Epsilonproteobacteria bacterium]|nr:MAG: LuxR family transcriptional regulator [Campylobacterota bacterium]